MRSRVVRRIIQTVFLSVYGNRSRGRAGRCDPGMPVLLLRRLSCASGVTACGRVVMLIVPLVLHRLCKIHTAGCAECARGVDEGNGRCKPSQLASAGWCTGDATPVEAPGTVRKPT